MDKLKPCPFCGNAPRMKSDLNSEGRQFYQVTHDCPNLLAQIKTFCYHTEAEAIAAWNRRTPEPNEPLTLAELRNMDGEPVYMVYPQLDNTDGWMLSWDTDDYTDEVKRLGANAYRRKPEEVLG